MAISVFISYSHVDESFKDQLDTQLKILQRENIIDTWHDRKILPGTDWEREIDTNLEKSELILFLISPDFIASDYCYKIEMQKAIQQHNAKTSLIVPIVIRPCKWSFLEINKFQALPKDAKPVSEWGNVDTAWLNVIEGINELTNKFDFKKSETISTEQREKVQIQPSFKEWLMRTGIQFQNKFKDRITFTDIYVYPDIRQLSDEINLFDNIISSKHLVKNINHNCIIGEEQIGKTALCKKLFLDYFDQKYYPFFIKGKLINTSNLDELIKRACKEQYVDCDINEINSENIIIIIDDFDKVKLNKKYRTVLIERITKKFDKVILTVSSTFRIELFDSDYMKNFKTDDLLAFGNARRLEIIQKWISLGQEETIEEEELFKQVDLTKLHIDTFVRKNIVPSKPIFILSILQTLESFTPNNLELTSYGHCYEYLILSLLKKININVKEIGTYVNYLSELAFYHFKVKKQFIQLEDLEEFRKEYSNKYLGINHPMMISNLEKCGIISQSERGFNFNYKYIYYYYVAKYLSDNYIQDNQIKEIFANLITDLHIEEYANIIIFITHHTKNPEILDLLQYEMMCVLKNENEASLNNDELTFLSEFILTIPKLIIEHKNPEEERLNHQNDIDTIEHLENGVNDEEYEDEAFSETYKIINKTFKSIEIIGQIIRNRHSSLPKKVLVEITDNSYSVGLRFLKYFLELSDKFKTEVIEYIKDILVKHPKASDTQVEKEARNTFLFLTYGMIFSVLKKISLGLGSTEAQEVYDIIENTRDTPAVILINISINLFFGKNIDFDYLERKYNLLSGNIVAQRLFRESVIQHIYMYQTSIENKQKIASKFQIDLKMQNLINTNKKAKLF